MVATGLLEPDPAHAATAAAFALAVLQEAAQVIQEQSIQRTDVSCYAPQQPLRGWVSAVAVAVLHGGLGGSHP